MIVGMILAIGKAFVIIGCGLVVDAVDGMIGRPGRDTRAYWYFTISVALASIVSLAAAIRYGGL